LIFAFQIIGIGLLALILSHAGVGVFRRWAEKRQILDIPNERSSHFSHAVPPSQPLIFEVFSSTMNSNPVALFVPAWTAKERIIVKCSRRRRSGSKGENQFKGFVNLLHSPWGKGSSQKRSFRFGIKKPGRVQRTDLEAEENSIFGKAGFPGCYPDVRRIIMRDILCVSPDDHCHDKGLPVDCISRNDQYGAISGLFPAFSGVKIDKIDVAAANHSSIHRFLSSGTPLRWLRIRP